MLLVAIYRLSAYYRVLRRVFVIFRNIDVVLSIILKAISNVLELYISY